MTRICVSIAENSLESLANSVQNALSATADFLEIRFDYLDPSIILNSLKILENIKNRCIFTIRSRSESGNFQESEDQRKEYLKMLSSSRPMLLDLEFNSLSNDIQLFDFVRSNNCNILVSWHDFDKTPDRSFLIEQINKMKKFSNNVKLVTTALEFKHTLQILDLYDDFPDLNLVSFAMGELGILSRILCPIFGKNNFTYASLGRPVAPGQLSIQEMRKIYEKLIKFQRNKE